MNTKNRSGVQIVEGRVADYDLVAYAKRQDAIAEANRRTQEGDIQHRSRKIGWPCVGYLVECVDGRVFDSVGQLSSEVIDAL